MLSVKILVLCICTSDVYLDIKPDTIGWALERALVPKVSLVWL